MHRASMICYAQNLLNNDFKIEYIDAQSSLCSISKLVEHLHKKEYNEFHYVDLTDNWVRKTSAESSREK
jgi:hypothetical protein